VGVALLETDLPGVGTTARRGLRKLRQTRFLSAGRRASAAPAANGANSMLARGPQPTGEESGLSCFNGPSD
jgi:hypothetical protein